MAIIGGALKYVGKKVGGAVAKDVIQHEIERNPIGGQALAGAQTIAGMAGRSIPGMKARGSFIGRAGNAAGMVNNINSHYGSVRQGNIRERNVPMNKMASVNHAYEDMVELKKEAARQGGLWGNGSPYGAQGGYAGGSHKPPGYSPRGGGGGKETVGDAAKKHVAKIGLTLATIGAIGGAKKLHSHYRSESTWKKIVAENPHMNSPEHRENFEVLKKFSPSIASNKTTARSYLQRAAHAGMMPHEFVKDLTAIEKTRDDSSFSGALAKKASDKRAELLEILKDLRGE